MSLTNCCCDCKEEASLSNYVVLDSCPDDQIRCLNRKQLYRERVNPVKTVKMDLSTQLKQVLSSNQVLENDDLNKDIKDIKESLGFICAALDTILNQYEETQRKLKTVFINFDYIKFKFIVTAI